MPNERVSMSKLKQLIALQASNLSVRAMARAHGLSVGAVSKYLRAVRTAGIGPTEAETLPENELEQRVFGPAPPGQKAGQTVRPLRGRTDRNRYSDRERSRPPARSPSVMGLRVQSITERDHKSVQNHQIKMAVLIRTRSQVRTRSPACDRPRPAAPHPRPYSAVQRHGRERGSTSPAPDGPPRARPAGTLARAGTC